LKLQESLSTAGNDVSVERVISDGDTAPRSKNVKLKSNPNISPYEVIIFGAPVHAFTLSPAMTTYLNQISDLESKKIACFVTKGLRFNWTGGNQAIDKMKKICTSKNGIVLSTEIIIWNKNRDKKINEMIHKFSAALS
jgi:hypothetical protein